MSKEIAVLIEEIRKQMTPPIQEIALAVETLKQKYAPAIQLFLETLSYGISEGVKQVKTWQKEEKILVSKMAEQGWFINWFTSHFCPKEKHSDLNDLMIAHIDESWIELKEMINRHCPERKKILEVAFNLHEEGNYIASIPLFLMQSDGICSEEFGYFFTIDHKTHKKAADTIIDKAESGEIIVNFFTEKLLEPFKSRLQLSQSASKSSKANKINGPNRHGIIHGSRKHLDYGSKINSYKAFSFLAFIVFTLKDEFKNKKTAVL